MNALDNHATNSTDTDTASPSGSESPEGTDLNPGTPEPQSFSSLIQIPSLLQRLDQLGFHTATPVQAAALAPAMEGKDLLLQAKTGSGKTMAFVLPMLAHLEKVEDTKQTFALIVSPTRELATQITEVITQLSDRVSPVVVIGGADQQVQQRLLNADARVVVGTPGRLLDLIKQKILRLNSCRYFVLDEADEMLSMGFIDDVRAILSRMPDKRQGLFVSATITPRVEMLAHSFLNRSERIVVDSYKTDSPPIEHSYVEVGGELMSKPWALCDIIETLRPRSAIIFCNTKSDTQLVEVLLRRRGFDARRINSDLTQNQRERIIQKIKAQDLQFLVATDIAARGIDIEQIDLVINYNIHEQPETYIHRTGRTGRAGRSGRAISLIGPRDFGAFHYLMKVVDFKVNKISLPTDEEVAAARLAHLYEIMRTTEVKVGERETIVARKLLSDRGNITEPPEELVEILAKLSQFAVEHVVNQEARSLDEELDAAAKAQQSREDSGEGQGKERRRDRDRGERGDRGDRGRGERDRGRRNDRRDSRDEQVEARDNVPASAEPGEGAESADSGSRAAGSEESRRDDNRRDDNRDRRRDNRERGDSNQDSERQGNRDNNRESGNEEVRLYVGQGSEHGMTDSSLRDLVCEFTNLEPDAIKHVTLRGHYSFLDTVEKHAKVILESMAGIEYNGEALPIEVAAVQERRHRGQNDRRGGGRRDQGRGGNDRGGRRNDNRNNSRGRNDNRRRDGGDRGRGRRNRDY